MPSVLIYARVSTGGDDGQDTGAQLRACQEYAERRGYTVREVYEDHASATNFRDRTAWRQMMADLKNAGPRTRPKGVVVFALDRAIRSLIDYVTISEQLKALAVDLVAIDGTLGEVGAKGDIYREAMTGFLAVFAQLERKVIVRRTLAGLANAKARGVKLGRREREIDWTEHSRLPAGLSLRQRARELGIPASTLRAAEQRRSENGVASGGVEHVPEDRPP